MFINDILSKQYLKQIHFYFLQWQILSRTQHTSIQGTHENPEATSGPLQKHTDTDKAPELRSVDQAPQPSWQDDDSGAPGDRRAGE